MLFNILFIPKNTGKKQFCYFITCLRSHLNEIATYRFCLLTKESLKVIYNKNSIFQT